MVGRRNRGLGGTDEEGGKGTLKFREELKRSVPKIWHFTDAADVIVEDGRRNLLKRKLIDGIERDELEKYRISRDQLKSMKNKKVRKFYERQNETLNDWLEVDALVRSVAEDILDSFNPDRDHDGIPERSSALYEVGGDLEALLPEDERNERQKNQRRARWAININVLANIVLLIAKVCAVFFTSSLSLIASMVDSALDLLCTLIIWSTNRLVAWRLSGLKRQFPVGRRRFESIGILVFSVIMVVSFLQILKESFEKLLPSGDHRVTQLPNIAIFSMVGTIVIKGIIGLGCMRFEASQVQALAQDCKTDVYFNTLSLLFPVIGSKLSCWWLDPLGAALLSLYIVFDWGDTCFSNIIRLSGSAANDRLSGFKNLVAYHAGDGIWVEVDVLLDSNDKLAKAHDIAETLQYCLEGLNEVDRAFVTIDYTQQGPSGHNEAQL